jgi:hypothetical protein
LEADYCIFAYKLKINDFTGNYLSRYSRTGYHPFAGRHGMVDI